MKPGILKDVVNSFVSVVKGLKVTLYNWSILRGPVTELYPEDKPNLPERYRGMPVLPIDPDTGRCRCIACGMCARTCPEGIITVVQDKTDPKDRKPAEFTIDISRCMFCGLCIESCPVKCLIPSRNFELACRTREEMCFNLEDLMRMGGQFPPKETKAVEPEEKKLEVPDK